MTSRRKSRRLEDVQEFGGDVRRSPRLRERYSRERSEGPSLLSVTHIATSRPGLSGYVRQIELEKQNDSILNESGQSVPAYFDLGQDEAESRDSGCNREAEGTDIPAQHYDTPDPQHLYGLDESDDEADVVDLYSQDKPGTPIPWHASGGGGSSSVVGWIVGGLMGVLFRLGSLLYLAATAVLCLDVIILHRCYMVFSAMTCWSSYAANKPWLRFCILPVVLCSLVAMLIGGGLVPTTEDAPQYNVSSVDLTNLHSELTASIRSTLSKDIQQHVEEQVDMVVKDWVEKKLKTELHLTFSVLEKLQSNVSLEISRVQADMAVLEERLTDTWNQTESSYVTEAIVMQILQAQILQHLNTAKQEWLKLIPQEMAAVTESVDQLRNDFMKKDKYFSKRLASLEKLVEENNSTITEALLQLISDTHTSSAAIASLTSGAESQTRDLASLKEDIRRLSTVEESERRGMIERLDALEAAGLSREDVVREFEEEMRKSVEDRSSVLWLWLSEELKKAEETSEIPASGLTKKDVNELIRIALNRYSADRIAKFDFALENSGGLVVSSSDTYPPALQTYSVMGVPLWSVPSSPKAIIQPYVYPGDCWAINGSSGYALIRLKEAVVVTSVTVEHIPKELTPSGSLSSAPKEFRILGKNETEPVTKGDVLGQFSYSIENGPIQEFSLKEEGEAYTHVLFEFLSNHGNAFYTCVYRVRVHGHSVTSLN